MFLLSTSIPPLLKLYFSENRKSSSLVERGNLLPGQKPNTYTVGNPITPNLQTVLQPFPEGVPRLTRKLAPIRKAPVPEMVCTVTYWSREASGQWGAPLSRRAHDLTNPSSSPQRGSVQPVPSFFRSRGHPSKWRFGTKRMALLFSFHFLRDRWTLLTGSQKSWLFTFQHLCWCGS